MTERRSTIIGVFEDRLEAERALRDLEAAGFNDDQLGFAIRGSDAVFGGMITDAQGTKDAKGALTGAVTGAAVGGLLALCLALTIWAGPAMRYLHDAAGALHAPAGYIEAVLPRR